MSAVRQGWFRLQNKHLATRTTYRPPDMRGGVGTSKFLGPTVAFRECHALLQAGSSSSGETALEVMSSATLL